MNNQNKKAVLEAVELIVNSRLDRKRFVAAVTIEVFEKMENFPARKNKHLTPFEYAFIATHWALRDIQRKGKSNL